MPEYEVRVDRNKCIGAGFCEKLAPQLFKLSEGKVALVSGRSASSVLIGESDLPAAIDAAKVCPSYAIEVLSKKTGKSVLGIEPDKEIPVMKIKAAYDSRKEWVMDPTGFFTIKPFPDEGIIKVRY